MPRKISFSTYAALQCLIAGLAATAQARAAQIPDYFFQQWTVTSNCTEQHAGLAARAQAGLQFRVSKDTASEDGSYVLETVDAGPTNRWAANWNGLRLEYRPGTKMSTVPADFECIAGTASTSPFLAMSGYVQTAEPYYEQQHWYGIATIHGQLQHVLIFPRDVVGDKSAIIVLQSASTPSAIQLDDNGVIISHN
jgi:hypothetical protein